VALGTTGEPAVLSAYEQREVVEICAEICVQSNGLLMVGTGSNGTRSTVEATRALEQTAGVTAALVVAPYYTRPSASGIVEHYRVVSSECSVPVVAYNVPYRTGCELGAADLLAIADLPNIVGLKQSVGCVDINTLEVLRNAPTDFHVFCGDDAYIVPTIVMGGAGSITAAAHVCTPQFVALVASALQGDFSSARALAEVLLPVVLAGFSEPNPSVWKAALHESGELATPNLRLPMMTASAAARKNLASAVEAACQCVESTIPTSPSVTVAASAR
jgi:4-hydroxy-tetrahydrodipicolinate synthase